MNVIKKGHVHGVGAVNVRKMARTITFIGVGEGRAAAVPGVAEALP